MTAKLLRPIGRQKHPHGAFDHPADALGRGGGEAWKILDRNFAVGCTLQFCIGIGLYGLTYVYPRYLAEIRGYSALMIGETMFVSGATMFLMAPVVGRLMRKSDLRYIIAFGLVTFALGSYQMTYMTRDYDFYELLLPQILRGIGMICVMVPTNNIALGTLPPDRVKNASGLFNLMRNLGGALGFAIINQALNDRADLHISRLQDRVTWGNADAVDLLNMLTQRAHGMGDAALMALKQLSQIVHRQAAVMSYADTYFMLTVFYAILSLLVIFVNNRCRRPAPATRISALVPPRRLQISADPFISSASSLEPEEDLHDHRIFADRSSAPIFHDGRCIRPLMADFASHDRVRRPGLQNSRSLTSIDACVWLLCLRAFFQWSRPPRASASRMTP